MSRSSLSAIVIVTIAVVVVIVAVAAGWYVFRGDPSLLRSAMINESVISPNADGELDATGISYEISQNAIVSIYFENEDGERFYFREDQPRGAGEYSVLFSGVVDGYRLPDELAEGEILARLLQDGQYTWTIAAVDEDGQAERLTGSLTIVDSDNVLPEIRDFGLDRHAFTPNQDGISDRVQIQFFLPKDVAQTRVFLLSPEGSEIPVAELERGVSAGEPGWHIFDYEGGVDNKATPPPDGTYPVIAIVEDDEGQRIMAADELTIQFGGVPRAEIIPPLIGDTVSFNATAVILCETLWFTMTVQNYGTTPIRTTGPSPGTVYDSDWNYNTLGWHTESGAWRVAIGYENEIANYPYRWSIGGEDDLEMIGDYYYLMPGERAVITGGIRVVDVFGERNPQPVWAGLIHEDVEISQFNNRVDPHSILLDLPDPEHIEACDPREIPEIR
jgi:hypothetical protein